MTILRSWVAIAIIFGSGLSAFAANPIIVRGTQTQLARWNAVIADCRNEPAFQAIYNDVVARLNAGNKTITIN